MHIKFAYGNFIITKMGSLHFVTLKLPLLASNESFASSADGASESGAGASMSAGAAKT